MVYNCVCTYPKELKQTFQAFNRHFQTVIEVIKRLFFLCIESLFDPFFSLFSLVGRCVYPHPLNVEPKLSPALLLSKSIDATSPVSVKEDKSAYFKIDGRNSLNIALDNQDISLFKLLLNLCGKDKELKKMLFRPDSEGDTPLFRAVQKGMLEAVDLLLASCEKDRELLEMLFQSNSNNQTLLHALPEHSTDILERILSECDLELKALLFQENDWGWNPLDLAIDLNNVEVINKILCVAFEVRYPFESIFKEINTYSYLMIAHPTILQTMIATFGGIERLTVADQLALLPIFNPNEIFRIIWFFPSELEEVLLLDVLEIEEEEIAMIDYLQRLMQMYDLKHYAGDIAEIQIDLEPIRFKHFAAVARFRQNLILPILPFVTEAQLACIIPLLSIDNCVQALLASWMKNKNQFIRLCTTVQKIALIHIESWLPRSTDWNKLEWENLIETCQTQLEDASMQRFATLVQHVKNGARELEQLKTAFFANEESDFCLAVHMKLSTLQAKFIKDSQEIEDIRWKLFLLNQRHRLLF